MTTSASLGGRYDLAGGRLSVNRIGFGAMQLPGPGVWGPPRDRDAAIALLREAVAAGIDHIDTAAFYGPDVANELIREALAPYPVELHLVTKVGFARTPDADWVPARAGAQLVEAVETNLRQLGVDALELVHLRVGDAFARTDESVAEPLGVLQDLQRAGKVRHLGISNASPAQVAEALSITEIAAVENAYNVLLRDDDAMIDDLARRGIAFTPFFPLGGISPLQSDVLTAVAASVGATPFQVALAWLLQRSPNILLIPGTSSSAHFRENIAAAGIELPADAVAALDALGASAS